MHTYMHAYTLVRLEYVVSEQQVVVYTKFEHFCAVCSKVTTSEHRVQEHANLCKQLNQLTHYMMELSVTLS